MNPLAISRVSVKSPFHENNEDACFVSDSLIIVADGMGGESSGDIASRIAANAMVSSLKGIDTDSLTPDEVRNLMFAAISRADREISDYIGAHPDSFGMGTTVLAAVIADGKVYIAWCGDSRCFLYTDGHLKSLTKDHSYVQELIDRDELSVEDSFTHPDSNLITRYVGGGEDTCLPEFTTHATKEGDTYIFCSDGLSGYCPSGDIENCIRANSRTQDLPSELLSLATGHGSDDDITIVTATSGAPRSHRRHTLFGWLRHTPRPAVG